MTAARRLLGLLLPIGLAACGHHSDALVEGQGAAQRLIADDDNLYWTITENSVYPNITTIRSAPRRGGEARVLATTRGQPFGVLALAGDRLVWTEGSNGGQPYSVRAVTKDGHDLGTMASGAIVLGSLASDGASVYWANYTSQAALRIVTAPLSGATQVELPRDLQSVEWLAVDDTNLYWLDTSANKAFRMPKGGEAAPAAIYSKQGNLFHGPIAVGADNLYFFDAGLTAVPKSLAAPSPVDTTYSYNTTVYAAEAKNLFFVHSETKYPRSNGSAIGHNESSLRQWTPGGDPAILSPPQYSISTAAAHAGMVYWVGDDGGIRGTPAH
jgi:hypothetical protein